MAKLQRLIVHCSDTPFGRVVTPDDLTFWHMFPCKNSNGSYTYLGKVYKTLNDLPNVAYNINGQQLSIRKYTNGRGWSVRGYSDMIGVNGELINITPYDFDSTVDPWEITNGAAGVNSSSRHIVMAGGWSKDGKTKSAVMPIENVFSEEQINTLISYIRMQREVHPGLPVEGHNMVSSKTCPNFDVKKFLTDYNV